jgi:hypothetical protein
MRRGKQTMSNKETMKKAGYEYYKFIAKGEHVLKDIDTGRLEIWCTNKNHASYGIIYKNTHLEFCGYFKGGRI